MCGIIGIIGRGEVAGFLVDGLKRLEYRGYDSAGVATLVDGHIERRRAEGKLDRLVERLKREPVTGRIGIAHTRWATHGVPNETNAHPIATDRVAVVHNGIIENFQELQGRAHGEGLPLRDPDRHRGGGDPADGPLKQGLSPREAAAKVFPRLEGAFALTILFAGEPDLLICARRSSPLAIGFGDGEMFLGSDALALAPLTRKILYLEEGDWAVVTAAGATVYDQKNREVQRPIRETALSGALIGKGNYRHFMEKEIYEQPVVIGDALMAHFHPTTRTVHLPSLPLRPRGGAEDQLRRLRHRVSRGDDREVLDRALGSRARRCRDRLRVPLSPARDAQGRARGLRLAVRRDPRYAGGAALRQGARASTSSRW